MNSKNSSKKKQRSHQMSMIRMVWFFWASAYGFMCAETAKKKLSKETAILYNNGQTNVPSLIYYTRTQNLLSVPKQKRSISTTHNFAVVTVFFLSSMQRVFIVFLFFRRFGRFDGHFFSFSIWVCNLGYILCLFSVIYFGHLNAVVIRLLTEMKWLTDLSHSPRTRD